MSDYNSSLPIRSEKDGADERVHIKIVDYADPDGASKQVKVSEENAHVRIHGQDPAGAIKQVRLSEDGAVNGDGVYDAVDNTNPANVGLVAMERDASPTEANQILRLTAKPNIAGDTVSLDVAIKDSDGEAFSVTNPLPVSIEESSGDEILDYQTSAAVAAAASVDFDYTVTALKTFIGDQVWAAASGKMKLEVKVETAASSGVFNTKFVAFNSTAEPNISIAQLKKLKVAAGVKVRLTLTNKDNQPQDLYATLSGTEV